jgi:hypothetical protein
MRIWDILLGGKDMDPAAKLADVLAMLASKLCISSMALDL